MAKLARAQFNEILGFLVKGRTKRPRKIRNNLYAPGAACALGAVLAGSGFNQRGFDAKYAPEISSIIIRANDTTPLKCDPDLAVINKLRELVVE